jgi:transposase
MIQTSPAMRILVAVEPVDFRRGIDGLAAVCRQQLEMDPMSGCLFVFRNRRATAVKLLLYDGQGFWLCQKRLSRGRFPSWPRADSPARGLQAHQLQVLLAGGDAETATGAPVWRPPSAPLPEPSRRKIS